MNAEAKEKLKPLQLEILGAVRTLHLQMATADAVTISAVFNIDIERATNELRQLEKKHFLSSYFEGQYFRPTDLSLLDAASYTPPTSNI